MEFSENPEITAQFLIAEFNALQERAKNCEEIKASRVNFFLVVVAALGASFSAAIQINILQQYYLEVLILTAIVVLLSGLSTLKHSVYYSGMSVIQFRRAGRIRRWFVDFDDKIENYVAFEPVDDKPTYAIPSRLLLFRGAETIVMIFNVVSISVIVASPLWIILRPVTTIYLSLSISSISSIIVGVLAWKLQKRYIEKSLLGFQDNDEKYNVNFPNEKYEEEKQLRQKKV